MTPPPRQLQGLRWPLGMRSSLCALPVALLFAGSLAHAQQPSADESVYDPPPPVFGKWRPAEPVVSARTAGSTYIPLDSWIYGAVVRLHGLGYADTAYLGLRPWTRLSVLHMLEETDVRTSGDKGATADEALDIYLALQRELDPDRTASGAHAELDTAYSRFLGITDTPLRDSYHLGQTVINDYGRPYQAGISNSSGLSGRAEYGRFSLFVRGEYQHSPSALGYGAPLSAYLSNVVDSVPLASNPVQTTLPSGPLASINNGRLLEATLSAHLVNHEISVGKTDHWWGPGEGGAFAWSSNADNLYSLEIDRVEPLYIPFVSRVTGPFRYSFFVGSLQGHSDPNAPWTHAEKLSFKPTRDLELGFERTVIWGGAGHEPVNVHTFFRSFFSVANTSAAVKFSPQDPGARFSAFDFNWRLPWMRNLLTLYTDSFAHDDVNPISAPRRAALRPGLYLARFPGLPKLDLRAEAAVTDTGTKRSNGGLFYFWEEAQVQGTTNKGFLFTDAIGRENKGGQAWLTYHLSPTEQVQVSWRSSKAAKDFIAGGTTQNEVRGEVVKRFSSDLETRLTVQYEGWRAPIYRPGLNTDVSVFGQVTLFPHLAKQF